MTWRTPSTTDDELDRQVAAYLGWRGGQLEGVPDATEMAWRIARSRDRGRPRWVQVLALAALAGLLFVATASVALVASRPETPLGPLGNGPLVVANALGWRVIDPSSGSESSLEPCDGQCPDVAFPIITPDGRSVVYVVPSPTDAAGDPAASGSSLWRWDRATGSTVGLYDCPDCSIALPVPSPDGRSIAFLEGPRVLQGAPADVVVVEASTGHEVRRLSDVDLVAPPAWDTYGRLLLTTGYPRDVVHRRFDIGTGMATEVGQGLPDGVLGTSPDGRDVILATPMGQRLDLYVVDQDLQHARLLVALDDLERFHMASWAPDGSAFAGIFRDVATDPADPTGEIRSYDVATGAVTSHGRALVASDLLWLPQD